MLQYIILLVLLLAANCYSLQTNHSIILHGGHCSICNQEIGEYTCSNHADAWNNGYFTFPNAVPSDHVITEVKINLIGEWGCITDYSTVSVTMQNMFMGLVSYGGQCLCGLCDTPIPYSWKQFGQCFPNYNYEGNNTVHVNVYYGLICLARIEIELTHEPGNSEGCGCGNYGVCKYRQMRCASNSTYQTCTYDESGRTYWGPVQACESDFTCGATGDYCYCYPPVSTHACTEGQMRCHNETSHQTCNVDGYWQPPVSCAAGSQCNPDPTGNNIICVAEEFLVQEQCQVHSMRCVSDNTYQMCHISINGTGVWNPVQECAEDHHCVTQGNVIYCILDETEEDCRLGDMRCVTGGIYQTCSLDANGDPFWNVEQQCQAGLSCHAHDNYIYCY